MKIRIMIILQFLVITITSCLYSVDEIDVNHKTHIVFGQSGSFSGHFKTYGNFIKNAILACFNEINAKGGIKGKLLKLVSLDDHGDAELTKKNIEFLYHKHKITMFIGVMGTRGILSVLPLIKEKKIALFFPWGSDVALRNPSLTNIINGPGLLQPQIDFLIKHILDTLHLSKIAIFHADDDFSSDAARYLTAELNKKNVPPVGTEQYNRFTMDIVTPTNKLIALDPRVVICLSTNFPTIKLINQFFEKGHFGTRFFGIDSTFLAKDILQAKGTQFCYTSSVPDPTTSPIPLAQSYRNAITKYAPDDGYSTLAFSYYVGAAIIVKALQEVPGPVSAAHLISFIEQIKNDNIQGFNINFDNTNRHIFGDTIWLI